MIDETHPNCDLRPDSGYIALKDYIIHATGLVYYADKDDDLSYRISRRLLESGQSNCSAYLELLQDPKCGPTELDRIVEALTVGETSFFRHAELFEALKRVIIPDLISRNQINRRLRIWSAGCSIGAEAYSLAILLAREFSDQTDGWDISILGTDINRKFLAQANAGTYRTWDFRGMDPWLIEAGFIPQGADWLIRPEYRRGVQFQYHNLVRHPFPSPQENLAAFDLVLCRNVLMYFGIEIMRGLLHQFNDSILDGGWLLVGHAEPSIELFRDFHTVNFPGAILYQKVNSPDKPDESSVPARETSFVEAASRNSAGAQPTEALSSRSPARSTCVQVAAPRAVRQNSSECAADILQFADQGNLELAMQKCSRQLTRDPMNPTLHFQHAMLAEQLGLGQLVEASLRRSLYLNPSQALAHYFSGMLEQKRGRRREAVLAYERVMELLAGLDDDDAVPHADGVRVQSLRELARMQEEALCEP